MRCRDHKGWKSSPLARGQGLSRTTRQGKSRTSVVSMLDLWVKRPVDAMDVSSFQRGPLRTCAGTNVCDDDGSGSCKTTVGTN